MKKKVFLIVIILGAALSFVPEFAIAGITTKMIGYAMLAAVFMYIYGVLLWKFHSCIDSELAKMRREQAKRIFKERNAMLFYPSAQALKGFAKYTFTKFLPRVLAGVLVFVGLYLALALLWPYIQPMLKYVGYAIGIFCAVILILCIIPNKSVDTEEYA